MKIFGKQSFIKLFFNRLILRFRGINPNNLEDLFTVQNYFEKNERTDSDFSIKLRFNEEELKNRISMSLTDPILQQYFEIICKRLEKMELKNASETN